MDTTQSRDRLTGCYVTIPTMFRDDDELSVDLDAIARHVGFLIDGGCVTGDAVLLVVTHISAGFGPHRRLEQRFHSGRFEQGGVVGELLTG